MDGNKKLKREKTSVRLNPLVKYPAMKLADDLGWSLAEYVERLLEAQLIKFKRIRAPIEDIEIAPVPLVPRELKPKKA